MTKVKTIEIKISKTNLIREYDPEIFLVDNICRDPLANHKEIARKLKNKNPYAITVIVDNLNPKFWNNSKYVEKTKMPEAPLFKELLYRYFFEEFDQTKGHELYAKWLKKYRPIWKKEKMKKELDDYIIKSELEPRYKERILKRYKNREKLFKKRTEIVRKRRYDLPQPLNYVDWRSPYDNIFVWEEKGKKYFRKGGSGSSGARQTNSEFIFGFGLINKTNPVKSYLFLYADDNQLCFIKEFSSLAVPRYDIGSNYFLPNRESEKILSGARLMEWENFNKLEKIIIK